MHDPTDDAALLERLGRELDGVEAALDRVDSGQFGRCEVCNGPIDPDRLAAHPIERRCSTHLQGAVAVLAADDPLPLGGEEPEG